MTTPVNVLVLCTDQQRYDALGAAGNPAIRTPNLDRLAAEGARFEQCYVQNPVCAPSRASLMTSTYVPTHGLWANGVDLAPSTRLFTRELADAGYDTGLVGKLHLGSCFAGRSEPRVDDGLRVFRWAHDPHPGSSENAYHRWLRAAHPDLYAEAARDGGAHSWNSMPTRGHYTHWIAEETIEFLQHGRRADRPFCFIANFFDPHHAFEAPAEYVEAYDGVELPPVVTVEGELDAKPAIQREASRRSYAGHDRGYLEYTAAELDEARRAYYAMVTLVDDEVGRILTALDEAGLSSSTLVIFTSDHGEMLGDHQLMLKGPFMYDCAVRVPLLMRLPGVIEPGTVVPELVQWVDLAPTILDVAGVPIPSSYQGESVLPLIRGERAGRGWAVSHYRNSGHGYDPAVLVTMLRTGDHKLVLLHGAPATDRPREGELYDLNADPGELVNLFDDPGAADLRAELTEQLVDVVVAIEDRSAPRLAHW